VQLLRTGYKVNLHQLLLLQLPHLEQQFQVGGLDTPQLFLLAMFFGTSKVFTTVLLLLLTAFLPTQQHGQALLLQAFFKTFDLTTGTGQIHQYQEIQPHGVLLDTTLNELQEAHT
jgi:hypothetical protein